MAKSKINDTRFECNKILYADLLNEILRDINGIIDYINDNENGWSSCEGCGGDLTTEQLNDLKNLLAQLLSSVGTVSAFAGFPNQLAADADLSANDSAKRKKDNGIPSGWNDSSNTTINDGDMLFMIVAETKNGVFLKYDTTNNYVWKGPYRIGSSNTTDSTGADDNDYNYIYCRTNSTLYNNGNGPNVDTIANSWTGNKSWNNFVELIEANPNYSFPIDATINIDSTTEAISSPDGHSIDSNTNNEWTDHPLGVTESYPYEWLIGLKLNTTTHKWEKVFGPICISHWGHNGMDGDGVEYIFYLVGETYNNNSGVSVRNGEISSPETYFDNLTYGKYRVPSTGEMSSYVEVNYSNLENDTNYQKDDFIPMGWHDEPYDVTLECYLQYVSIRKKNWILNEKESKWGPFSSPRKWNNYSAATASGLTITLTNDNIFVDDDTSSDGLEYASKNMILIWNGTTDVTKPGTTYGKIEVSIDLNSDSGSLRTNLIPCRISSLDSNGDSVVINDGDKLTWGVFYPLPTGNAFDTFKEKGFCLTAVDLLNFNKNGTANEDDLKEGMTAAVTYTAKLYTNANDANPVATVSRQLTLLVLNFSNGEAYSLIVSPNTLGISRATSSSNYTFRSGENLIKISANEANGKQVLQKALLTSKPSAGNKGLYIKVKERTSSGLSDARTTVDSNNHIVLSGSNTTEITCTFTKGNSNNDDFSFAAGDIQSFEIELWCVYDTSGNEIMVDTETVDFSIKGDDGTVDNLQGTVLGIISNMNLESYVITGINDNAVIDDQTITVDALRNGTENELTVKKGGSTSGGNLFKITNITLGSNSSLLDVYYYDSGYVIYTNNSGTNNDGWVSSNKFAILPKWDSDNRRITTIEENTKLTTGNFYYDVLVKNNEGDVGTKRFNLDIFDISIDGSYYKLNILNDVLSYDSEEDILSTEATSKIEIYTVDLQGLSTSFIELSSLIYPVPNNSNNYVNGTLYIDFGDLENYVNKENGYYKVTQDSNTGNYVLTLVWNNSIQYKKSGYDITLYKCIEGLLKQLDKEHIDCIKDGAPGNNGYNSVIVRLYKRSNSIISSHGILNTTYYDFENEILYKTNSGGILSNEVVGIKTNPSSDLNGWSSSVDNATISDGTEYDNSSLLLYMTAATAMGNSSIDDISNTEWSDPIPVSNDGSTPDYNIRTIYLYQYSETCPNKPNYNEISSPYRVWYRFSNNRFYMDKDVLDSDTSGTQGTVNVDNNWRLSISTSTNLNLWETHATAVSLTDEDEIKSIEWSTPSIVSSKITVESGKTGKMFYMMGVWDSNKIYQIDDLKIPVVFYDDGESNSSGGTGHYYYLNPDLNTTVSLSGTNYENASKNNIPGSSSFSNGTVDNPYNNSHEPIWIKADDFGLVITEGIFSEFAKLGSAVISGDYMLSLNGKIDDNLYLDGAKYPDSNGVPAYTMFDSNLINKNIPVELFSGEKNITIEENNDANNPIDTGIELFISNRRFKLRVKVTFTHNSSTDDNILFAVELGNSTCTLILANRNSSNGINMCDTITSLMLDSLVNTFFNSYTNLTVKLCILSYSHSVINVKITQVEVMYDDFKPNWWVDLRNGKMSAGCGNFIVNPDGSVEAASGNFIINPDGTVEAAGGKFLIDINGNLIIDGGVQNGSVEYKYSTKLKHPNIIKGQNSSTTNLYDDDKFSDVIVIKPKSLPDSNLNIGISNGDTGIDEFTTSVGLDANATGLYFYAPTISQGFGNSSNMFTYNFKIPNPNYYKNRKVDIYVGGKFSNFTTSNTNLTSSNVQAYLICDDDGFYPVILNNSHDTNSKIMIGHGTDMTNGSHIQLTSLSFDGGNSYRWLYLILEVL